mgnify:CR=1 FL=1
MKKALLINVPVSIYKNKTAFVPLALLVMGTCLKHLREKGADIACSLLDLDLMIKKGLLPDDESFFALAGQLIVDREPDLLLFTVHGPNHILVLKLAERIKRQWDCLIVAGGVGPSLKAKEALERCQDIDIIVKGEGEPALEGLVAAVLGTGRLADVPSIVYRENGRVLENPRQHLPMDQPIPAPDYSLIRLADYLEHNKTNPYVHPGFVLIESGRGCVYGCSFCAPAKMWERKVRYRPVPEIIEEMHFLADQGGNFSFFTQDNLDPDFLRELSEALVLRHSNIPWGCYSRLDRLPVEMADLLAKAGCKIIFTGLETTSPSAQKQIRKVIDAEATFEKLQLFNKNGIRFIGSFIAGFGGETPEELEHTMRFAIECAAGQGFDQLKEAVAATTPETLPQAPDNICVIHPYLHMVGTDSFEEMFDQLYISKYSVHPDCYGSYLFRYENFKDDWSFLGTNPYISHLPEQEAGYYCSILRLFNFMNSRPYYFALLMQKQKVGPLELLHRMSDQLGEALVLEATIDRFEERCRDYVKERLGFVPQWTVKKGQ